MQDIVYRAAKQSASDPFEFVMSDESVDRYGDVIVADGWDLKEFRSNPIALFNHSPNSIIGKWENVRIEGKRLVGKLALAAAGTSALVDEVRSLWEQGIVKMVSVGFLPIESEPLDKNSDDDWFPPMKFLKQKLLECSMVAIPANPNAGPLKHARSFLLPTDAKRQLFGKSASEEIRNLLSGTSRVSATPPPATGKKSMKSPLAKQIETKQAEMNRLRDRLTELAGVEDRDDEQEALYKQLPDAIKAVFASLTIDQNAEKALGLNAAEGDDDDSSNLPAIIPAAPQRPFAMPKKKIEAADYCFRAAAAGMRAFALQVPVEKVIRENYGNDEATLLITKAAVNPAMTTTTGYAAELVQTGFGAFMDRLIAKSIYAPMSDAGTRYDLGKNGSVKIPYRASTPLASGAWVGEGAPKPVKRIGLAAIELKPHKVACITVYTEEMANSSVPAIEGILRKAMADDTQASLDGFLIDAVVESAVRPAGLLVGATAVTASAAATTLEKIVADINGLIAPMEQAGAGGKVVLIMNPAQARKIGMVQTATGDFAFGSASEAASKFGVDRIISSITVPAGKLIAVDADWFVTATGDLPRFAVSNEATIHEEDTAPLPLVTGVQGSGVVASPMRSLFQTDSIAIRLSLYVTWGMVRSGMVSTIAAVGW